LSVLAMRDADGDGEGWAEDTDGPPPPSVTADGVRDALRSAAARRDAGNSQFASNRLGSAEESYDAALDALHVTVPSQGHGRALLPRHKASNPRFPHALLKDARSTACGDSHRRMHSPRRSPPRR
jgi:hypothetical protein